MRMPLSVLQQNWKGGQTEALAETHYCHMYILNVYLFMYGMYIHFEIELDGWERRNCMDEMDTQLDNFDDETEEDETKREVEKSQNKITPDRAINTLNTTIQLAEEYGLNLKDIKLLQARETAVTQKVAKHKTQTKIIHSL